MPIIRKKEQISASKSWWGIAAVVNVVTFFGMAKMVVMDYQSMSGEKWPVFIIAYGGCLLMYLIMNGAIGLGSVKADNESVRQTKFFTHGRFFVTNKLRWEDITKAEVKPGAYRLSGASISIEIHTMVFSDPLVASRFIFERLPNHLKQ